jgi:hypothetical protein
MSPETSQERIALVVTAAGVLMGALVDLGEVYELRKPRALQTLPAGNNITQINFIKLIGDPTVVVLTGDVVFWQPTEQNVVQGYLQSISPIKIASALPRRVN